jgi:hypothetical protein
MSEAEKVHQRNEWNELFLSGVEAHVKIVMSESQSAFSRLNIADSSQIIPTCEELLKMIAQIRGHEQVEGKKDEEKAVTDDQVKLFLQEMERKLLDLKQLYSDHKGRYQSLIKYSDIESKAFEKISECFTEIDKVLERGVQPKEAKSAAIRESNNMARGVAFRNALLAAYKRLNAKIDADLQADESAYVTTVATLRDAFKDMQNEKQKAIEIMHAVNNLMQFLGDKNPQHAQNFNDLAKRFNTLYQDIEKLEQEAMKLEQIEKLFSAVRQDIRKDIQVIMRDGQARTSPAQWDEYAKQFTRAQYEQEWKQRIDKIKKEIEGYFTGLRNKQDPNRRMNALNMRQHFHDAVKLLDDITNKIDEVIHFVKAQINPQTQGATVKI